jgi:hypothetical protein
MVGCIIIKSSSAVLLYGRIDRSKGSVEPTRGDKEHHRVFKLTRSFVSVMRGNSRLEVLFNDTYIDIIGFR